MLGTPHAPKYARALSRANHIRTIEKPLTPPWAEPMLPPSPPPGSVLLFRAARGRRRVIPFSDGATLGVGERRRP
jgi:hypothetical protein